MHVREVNHFIYLTAVSESKPVVTTQELETRLDDPYAKVSHYLLKILQTKEAFRALIGSFTGLEEMYAELEYYCTSVSEEGTYRAPSLERVSNGISGTYFLGEKFVIKPFDEEAGCLNNPKYYGGLHSENPVRKDIPLYHSAMREALAYQVALSIGVESIAPKTFLAILESSDFFHMSDRMSEAQRVEYIERCGEVDREKLCSVQEYVVDSMPLFTLLQKFQMEQLTDEEIGKRLDQSDVEEINLLVWATYDTDAHAGNLLAYPKSLNEKGEIIYGLKKIDNGLAFPEKNRSFRNHLMYLPNGEAPLSEAGREKIRAIDLDVLEEQFIKYDLKGAIPALRERISYLKELAERPQITLKEISLEIKSMEETGGNQWSL